MTSRESSPPRVRFAALRPILFSSLGTGRFYSLGTHNTTGRSKQVVADRVPDIQALRYVWSKNFCTPERNSKPVENALSRVSTASSGTNA